MPVPAGIAKLMMGFTTQEETKMEIFVWVWMIGFVAYVIFIQKEDDDFVGDKAGMIAKTIVFVVLMALTALAYLLMSAVPKEYQTMNPTTMTALLFVVVFLMWLIYQELKTMRNLAQIFARRIFEAEERAERLSRGEG
jgi:hypothetical protein